MVSCGCRGQTCTIGSNDDGTTRVSPESSRVASFVGSALANLATGPLAGMTAENGCESPVSGSDSTAMETAQEATRSSHRRALRSGDSELRCACVAPGCERSQGPKTSAARVALRTEYTYNTRTRAHAVALVEGWVHGAADASCHGRSGGVAGAGFEPATFGL